MKSRPETSFPPVFYARYPVETLSPAQIDEMLQNGWFRNDIHIGTGAVKNLGDLICPSVMLRIPLKNFEWKKRLRKLLRRNEELFSVKIQPFEFTPEKDLLWVKFKKEVHNWMLVPSLQKHLFRESLPENFNTWEVSLFYKNQLVALSFFDLGERSLASLEAAYDPAFARHSLGLHTMLLEIKFAQRLGLDFYYPGFYPKDVPMFEYKLRPGGVEFFRLTERRWLPWEQLSGEDWLLDQLKERLGKVAGRLAAVGIPTRVAYGHFIWKPSGWLSPEAYNLLLVVENPAWQKGTFHFLIAWDVLAEQYLLFQGDLLFPLSTLNRRPHLPFLFLFNVGEAQFLGAFDEEKSLADRIWRAGK